MANLMMRIAFFSDTYHPCVDGVVRSIDNFASQLQKQGHEVKVFAPEGERGFEKKRGAVYAPSIRFPPYPQYRIPVGYSGCIEEAAAFKPDIVHSHAMVVMGMAAKAAAKKCKCPLVGTFHTLLPKAMHYATGVEGLQLWGENISWKYLQWLYSGFDEIMAPSEFMQKQVAKYKIKASVVPNPVDLQKFCPGKIDPRAKAHFPHGKTLMYFGRVAKEKNISFLLEMAKTPKFSEMGCSLLVAGSGPYGQELEQRAKKMNLEGVAKFPGKVEEELVPSFYRAASCSAFASEFETQGLTALESMACGTPVLALGKTALAEIVKPGLNGGICSKNAQEAAYLLEEILENREKLSKGAVKTAQEYSVEKCTKKLLAVYEKALKK